MDIEKLDQEVRQILLNKDETRGYSEIRDELVEKGYNQDELSYIMGLVDEKLLSKVDINHESRIAKRNMVLGGILSLIGLTVTANSYFGQQAPKEVYYVSLVIFAVGYLVFRNGYRRRSKN